MGGDPSLEKTVRRQPVSYPQLPLQDALDCSSCHLGMLVSLRVEMERRAQARALYGRAGVVYQSLLWAPVS